MILLAGDLFHENKPSRKTMHRCMELLRHYCMGNRPCHLEFLSDSSVNFYTAFGTVNFEDPNYNVGMPVFSIHGNHDDPSGDANLAALDILSVAGLVNYFGKSREVDDITVMPILMKKGRTGLALYGLGSIRDERLHRTFLSRKVKLLRPNNEDVQLTGLRTDDWFNLMLFHQNRVAHNTSGYIPESFLDDFLHLVVWGHEHDCEIEASKCAERDFFVCQPGSSVATSLSEGECKRAKSVALVDITGTSFQLTPLVLKSVRPFGVREVSLKASGCTPNEHKKIEKFLSKQVSEMVEACQAEWHSRNVTGGKEAPLPLVRLKVDYAGGYQSFNPQRFGQAFVNIVANPRDILLFHRKRELAPRKPTDKSKIGVPKNPDEYVNDPNKNVEDLVGEYLGHQHLALFPHNEFGDCVRIYVDKDDRDVIDTFVRQSLERICLDVTEGSVALEETVLRTEIERSRQKREEEWHRMHPGIDAVLSHKAKVISKDSQSDDENDDDGENRRGLDIQKRTPVSARGRGRGRGGSGVGKTTVQPSRTYKGIVGDSSEGEIIPQKRGKASLKFATDTPDSSTSSRWPTRSRK